MFDGAIFLKKVPWEIKVASYENEEQVTLSISEPRFEFENPAMQKKILTIMAEASGGEFIELNALATLAEKIKKNITLSRNVIEKTIWDTWLMLLIITCAASLEWFLRKRKDLP